MPTLEKSKAYAAKCQTWARLHLHLRQIPPGPLPDQTEDPARPHADEARGHQEGLATVDAPAHPPTGEMAGAGRQRILQLPRRADEQPCTRGLPRRDRQALVADTPPTQPKRRSHLGSDAEARGRLASATAHTSPLAQPPFGRHAPEVGAVCGKAARTDLCGGRGVTRVPTATTLHAACVALSARQIQRRAAKSVSGIRLSRPTLEMPAERQPEGPVEEADRGRRRACPMSHIAWRPAPALSAS